MSYERRALSQTEPLAFARRSPRVAPMLSVHDHPRPRLTRLTHVGAALVLAAMLLGALGLLALGLADARFRLLVVASGILLLLAPAVLLVTTITPPLSVRRDGLAIRPVLWRPVEVAWSDVRAVKPYPLLPAPEGKVGRRMLVGKRRYRAAEGTMLVIPALPALYRVNGIFCGEGLTPVVAFTTRSHRDYDRLVEQVRQHTGGKHA